MGETYRQVTRRLRVQRGPGRPDLVSERPVELSAKGEPKTDARGNVRYTDSEESPTLVTFDEHCRVRVDQLLRVGAIAEHEAPKTGGKGQWSRQGEAEAAEGGDPAAQGTEGRVAAREGEEGSE